MLVEGLSRRSFYELFDDKEECFLATHHSILARQRKRLIDVWLRQRGHANRLHAACATLLEDIAAHPKGPRLVLIESLDIRAAARARMQLTAATFECLVESVLQAHPVASELAGVSSRAIVGGISQLVALRVLDGRERELASLAGEVLDWIDSYRAPASARLATLQPRARSSIASRSTVPAAGSHLQHGGGHACSSAAVDEFTREALHHVKVALQAARSWPEAVDRAMEALVAYLRAHRALLRPATVQLFNVGPRGAGPVSGSIEQLTALLTADAPPPRRAPALAREAMTGAISAVIAGHLAGGRPPRPPCLADQLTYTVLAPFLGARAAVDEIAAARRPLAAG